MKASKPTVFRLFIGTILPTVRSDSPSLSEIDPGI